MIDAEGIEDMRETVMLKFMAAKTDTERRVYWAALLLLKQGEVCEEAA